ncbi:hypothetical protein KFE98_18805 [bacterium SCSIO 12741]|nr:hypothetical protein KFE98_18805 [bacterium SCSIO 12741]
MDLDLFLQLLPYIAAGIVGGISVFFLLQWIDRSKQTKRLRRGREKEQEALGFLEEQGFTLVDYQPELSHDFNVDGKVVSSTIRPDVKVKKGGQEYLVEIKSGEKAISPQYSSTRRQLLEYALVNGKSKILLVDMEGYSISTIEFPLIKGRSTWKATLWKVLALCLLAANIGVIIYLAASAILAQL